MNEFYINKENYFTIDVTKINTIEDICKILDCLNIQVGEQYHKFDILKPYLKKIENE